MHGTHDHPIGGQIKQKKHPDVPQEPTRVVARVAQDPDLEEVVEAVVLAVLVWNIR